MIWSGEGGSSHTRAPLASTMVSLPGNLPLIGFWDMWVTWSYFSGRKQGGLDVYEAVESNGLQSYLCYAWFGWFW